MTPMAEVGIAHPQMRDWWRMQEALLGFIVREQEPLQAAALWELLTRRLRGADLPLGRLNWMLARLQNDDLIAPVPWRTRESRSFMTYVATAKGVRHLNRWMHSPIEPPHFREEILVRMAVCSLADVSRLIELVRQQEQACMQDALSVSFVSDEIALRRINDLPVDEWMATIMVLLRDSELELLEADLRWLQAVRVSLEGIR